MAFILFLLSYALNPLIVFAVPEGLASSFLLTYALSSGFFSLFFYWLFVLDFTVQKANKIILYLAPISLVSFAFNSSVAIWIFYTFALLLGDYVTTQTLNPKASNIYRAVMIASALPFLFFYEYFEVLLIIRAIISISFAVFLSLISEKFYRLNVKHSTRYLLVTYISFMGSLTLISLTTLHPVTLKIWFVTTQIGLGLMLKRLDFSLRSISKSYNFLFRLMTIAVLLLPIISMFLSTDFKNLIIYYIAVTLLLILIKMEAKKS